MWRLEYYREEMGKGLVTSEIKYISVFSSNLDI